MKSVEYEVCDSNERQFQGDHHQGRQEQVQNSWNANSFATIALQMKTNDWLVEIFSWTISTIWVGLLPLHLRSASFEIRLNLSSSSTRSITQLFNERPKRKLKVSSGRNQRNVDLFSFTRNVLPNDCYTCSLCRLSPSARVVHLRNRWIEEHRADTQTFSFQTLLFLNDF